MRRKVWQSSASAAKQGGNNKESGQAAASAASWVSLYCCCGRNDDRSSMCTSAQIIGSLLVLSVLEIGLGLSSVAVGAVTLVRVRVEAKQELGDSSPVWSGACFLMCGVCGIFCAKKKSGLIMILFSACCICGLIGGILNIQFLRALTKRSSSLYSLQLASISLACIGISGCTISTWLTCRLASYEQRRMFLEREHSLHHSHEMTEKETAENGGAQMVFNGRV